MAMAYGPAVMSMLIEYMERCNAMLALHEQEVRQYWCMFEFECVIPWYNRTMHHGTIAIAHSPAMHLQ